MFQSTHPRRVWRMSAIPLFVNLKFQSTHPRRVWQKWELISSHTASFNPHTHAGCDLTPAMHHSRITVSIHTPTQGVTVLLAQSKCFWSVSIHTPTQGVTNVQISCGQMEKVSIHTPTQGVTTLRWTTTVRQGFQSTHPRRVWLAEEEFAAAVEVSIHTPTQGVTDISMAMCWCIPVSIHTPTQGVTS